MTADLPKWLPPLWCCQVTIVPPTDMIIQVFLAIGSVMTVWTFKGLLTSVDHKMPLHFGWPH